MVSSRLPGFYRLPLGERRRLLETALGWPPGQLATALEGGGLDVETADKTVENVIGTYALPLGVAVNLRMNGRDWLAPMAVEEPSVIAAASNAARMVRQGGGFVAEADPPIMIAQVELDGVADVPGATRAIEEAAPEILALSDAAVPGLVGHGGGARGLEVRAVGEGLVVVHVLLDCRDAMGANLANTVAEAVGPRLAALAGGSLGLCILSNLCDRRRVRVRCEVPLPALAADGWDGEATAAGIVRAARLAERDPYRAATHNKGILNGIDPVVLATGNDGRAVEAGAHAWAARLGRYAPLSRWSIEDGKLAGFLELPLALGIVGGTLRAHRGARLALALTGVGSAAELAMLAASVGLASNLAALRALGTTGIQRGHMALHARSVALSAGARGEEVDVVADQIHARGQVDLASARAALQRLRPDAPAATG